MQLRLPLLALVASIFVLQGCAYPKVVKYYDEECQIMAKRMERSTDPLPGKIAEMHAFFTKWERILAAEVQQLATL